MSANYQETLGEEFNVKISILIDKRQIQIVGKEQNVAKCEKMIKEDWSTLAVNQKISSTTTTTVECPICCEPANYSLQACGHAYCLNCLQIELSGKYDTTLSNESLMIKCSMPQCSVPLLLRDIKTIINPTNMSKLARASFQAYLKTDRDIIQCMGVDCKQVYRRSIHPRSYFCDGCLKSYCVRCQVEYHTGLTCDAYQELIKRRNDEESALFNIGEQNFKACPSCKQVIDRYEGCNAVKCKCGISFCWLCLKTDPDDIHYHFGDQNSSCYNKCFSPS